jgi:hypothetical protein
MRHYLRKKEFFPMTAEDLKTKRVVAGIPGYAVCQVAGLSRAKLSDIERGYVPATAEELQRIEGAIEQIVRTRQRLEALATEAGLPLTGIRL